MEASCLATRNNKADQTSSHAPSAVVSHHGRQRGVPSCQTLPWPRLSQPARRLCSWTTTAVVGPGAQRQGRRQQRSDEAACRESQGAVEPRFWGHPALSHIKARCAVAGLARMGCGAGEGRVTFLDFGAMCQCTRDVQGMWHGTPGANSRRPHGWSRAVKLATSCFSYARTGWFASYLPSQPVSPRRSRLPHSTERLSCFHDAMY